MNRALIVVDYQNDFVVDSGTLMVPSAFGIGYNINALAKSMPVIVLTQDWHPENHCSFASSRGVIPFTKALDGSTLWPNHCVQGSWGAQLCTHLDHNRAQLILRKGMLPYKDELSAFDSRALHAMLRELWVDTVVVCGVALDVCVAATAIDAAELGYTTIVDKDACAATSEEAGKAAIERMKKHGIYVR